MLDSITRLDIEDTQGWELRLQRAWLQVHLKVVLIGKGCRDVGYTLRDSDVSIMVDEVVQRPLEKSTGKKRERSESSLEDPLHHGPATASAFSVVWETTLTAILTVNSTTWICLKGRGEIESKTSESNCFVQGYRLTKGIAVPFESPPWGDALVTLTDIKEGSMFRISSIPNETIHHVPTFEILHITDKEKMRPLKPIKSWVQLFPKIVADSQVTLSHSASTPKDERGGFIVLFTGASGVGKSTCMRMCYNLLLQHHHEVAVLDGNPTTNGMLQLHIGDRPAGLLPYSEPLDGNSRMVASHFFGCIGNSARWDPQIYLHCISSLLDVYLKNYVAVPLLIDTEGWMVKELGFETLKSLVFDVIGEPDHVVQVQGETPSKKFDLTDTGPESKLLKFSSVTCYDTYDEARQAFAPQRVVRLVRMVCSILPKIKKLLQNGKVTVDQQGFEDPMSRVADAFAADIPLVAKLDEVTIFPEDISLGALKGAVVGLCQKGDHHQVSRYGPALLRCVGIGVVRAIDVENRLLFLLTDLPNPPAILVTTKFFKLPLECSFHGIHSSTFAGKSFDDTTILGSEPMSSRSLDRKVQLNMKNQ